MGRVSLPAAQKTVGGGPGGGCASTCCVGPVSWWDTHEGQRGKGRSYSLLPCCAGIWLQIRMCSFLFHISEHGQIKEDIRVSVSVPLVSQCWDWRGSRELLTWKTLADRATSSWFSLGGWLPCPCGPSVTAAVGPGRLSPLDLVLTLPPDSSSPPTAEEDVQEQTGRGQDCPEGAGPTAACMGV